MHNFYLTPKLFILFLILLLQKSVIFGQVIDIQVVPPQRPDFQMYELWYVTAINNSPEAVTGFFEATVYSGENSVVAHARSASVTLEPGITIFNYRNYTLLEPINNIRIDPRFEEYILRTNSLPPGEYEVCVRFFSFPEGEELAERCYFLNSDKIIAPALINPPNKSIVQESRQMFVWSPASGTAIQQNLNYELTIVEILAGQSEVAAIQSNRPFFFMENLTSPMQVYPAAARSFREGTNYAWQVKARTGTFVVAESEVWVFRYQKQTDEDEDEEETDTDTTATEDISGNQFYALKTFIQPGFYAPASDVLYFTWFNPYREEQPDISISDNHGNEIYTAPLEAIQSHGLNFNSLNLLEIPQLNAGVIYTLQLKNEKGMQYSLRFRQPKIDYSKE
ncbi:MAG: hypothetical protein EA393_12560 [Bacteroidetes bacterium]|nr:MAG: hypothetical protein EA393_12560 [Bacteroidota bacterium]